MADTLGGDLPRALCLTMMAGLALLDGRSADSTRAAAAAMSALSSGVAELPLTALPHSVSAAVHARNGEVAAARRALVGARRLSAAAAGLMAPWFSVLCNVFQAWAALSLRDYPTARVLLRQAGDHCCHGPGSGVLRTYVGAAQAELGRRSTAGPPGYQPLTTAELRVLHHLPTQLSFPEIAGGLFLSRHTVKTQAMAIYHKLGVSSRTAAVGRARTLGLLPELAAAG